MGKGLTVPLGRKGTDRLAQNKSERTSRGRLDGGRGKRKGFLVNLSFGMKEEEREEGKFCRVRVRVRLTREQHPASSIQLSCDASPDSLECKFYAGQLRGTNAKCCVS